MKYSKRGECPGFVDAMLRLSRLFKEAILDEYYYMLELQENNENINSDELELLQAMHTIWGLVEICLFKGYQTQGTIVKGFAFAEIYTTWYRFNFPETGASEPDVLILRKLVRGEFEQAIEILDDLCKKLDKDGIQVAEGLKELILNHPMIQKSGNKGIQQWVQRAVLFSGNLPQLPKEFEWLYRIAMIICGDQRYLSEQSENWLEYLGGELLFGLVHNRVFDLHGIAKHCFDELGDMEKESDVGKCLASVLLGNYGELFVYLSKVDLWLCTHIVDFIFNFEALETSVWNIFNSDPRLYYLTKYGDVLSSHEDYWLLSLDYYMCCGKNGHNMAEEILLRQPLENYSKFNKLLGLCKIYGFETGAESLYKNMGAELLRKEEFIGAIDCYYFVGSEKKMNEIGREILRQYLNTGSVNDLRGVESLCSSIISQVPILRSLQMHYNLLQYLKSGETLEITRLIAEIFGGGEPNEVWPVVIIDTIAVLNSSKVGSWRSEHFMEMSRASEELRNSPIKYNLYEPIISSSGNTLMSTFKTIQDVDDALLLFIYNNLKHISFI
ncbi:hypothetical protein BB559_006409 [Furculomyces boomerangus]|uniref:Nuclear pore complex protein Nup85 n=1 Tax=Furculomyces boomerangus TaxID=61424 RepID=A0A2T9Y356_9FUNG|nr:hypothetical protein BB559_006409 [Furculomyces boomerangus]